MACEARSYTRVDRLIALICHHSIPGAIPGNSWPRFFCGVGLQADTLNSSAFPPEGGAKKNTGISHSRFRNLNSEGKRARIFSELLHHSASSDATDAEDPS